MYVCLHDGFFISLSAVLFTLFGFYQMAVWARNYRKEFKDYPKGWKAIVPFSVVDVLNQTLHFRLWE